MIELKQLHTDGEGRITYLAKRINQIGIKYLGDVAIRKGIQASTMSVKELRKEYIADNYQEPKHKASVLDQFQL